jgi:hypothetical protein
LIWKIVPQLAHNANLSKYSANELFFNQLFFENSSICWPEYRHLGRKCQLLSG